MTTLLSELAALEQSTDPEKREVGARLRTAIRNVLLDELANAKVREFLEDFPPTEYPWDWEIVGTADPTVDWIVAEDFGTGWVTE